MAATAGSSTLTLPADRWRKGGLSELGSGAAHAEPLPPSTVEQEQCSATLLCTASGGFPSDWTLGLEGGGAAACLGGVVR
ncbi:hypothetical protein N1851_001684 [Merluccius polli]|uniref:Ig-like domain-containing protein n=1 Tax=Merluccius polli TaxID=89951 RepID=A0AA47NB65_MERPO|nr:hypothetical protein N1851_001684 [Merluccius polli]